MERGFKPRRSEAKYNALKDTFSFLREGKGVRAKGGRLAMEFPSKLRNSRDGQKQGGTC